MHEIFFIRRWGCTQEIGHPMHNDFEPRCPKESCGSERFIDGVAAVIFFQDALIKRLSAYLHFSHA